MNTVAEEKRCSLCQCVFPVFEEDLTFYQRFDVPAPDLCFDCRFQRRLAFYNRRKLYRRTCDYSQKPIVSMFSPDKEYTVYEKNVWYSDAWDPMDYGRDFDFSRPFFEQFDQFLHEIPLLSLAVVGESINSEFANDMARLKNCYLAFDCADSEGVLFGETFVHVRDSADIHSLADCELCYDCSSCYDSYQLRFGRFCKNCSDSWFLRDCIGCRNCFGCANLNQAEFYVFNEQKSKEEYEEFVQSFVSSDYKTLQGMKTKVEEFFSTLPQKAVRGVRNFDSVGDFLNGCKNAYWCFNSNELEDSRYCTDMMMGAKDCMDIHVWGDRMEVAYNCCIVGEQAFNIMCCCFVGLGASDTAYTVYSTRNCSNLFGCIGLQKKQYCILNKQYSQDDYHEMRDRIVTHMKETGEWGEFFPAEISPFGYNESLAPAFYPLARDEVLQRGWKWSDYDAPIQAKNALQAADLPGDIGEVNDDILDSAITCEVSGRPFRIVRKELEFYREQKLPLPRLHPDERHHQRFQHTLPYSLQSRVCGQCGCDLICSAPEAKKAHIYCEKCYREHVY